MYDFTNQKRAIYTLIYTFLFSFSISLANSSPPKTPPPKIFILQIIEHPALNATRDGFIDELSRLGYKEGETLILEAQSAQGNTALATQIAQKFVSKRPDII